MNKLPVYLGIGVHCRWKGAYLRHRQRLNINVFPQQLIHLLAALTALGKIKAWSFVTRLLSFLFRMLVSHLQYRAVEKFPIARKRILRRPAGLLYCYIFFCPCDARLDRVVFPACRLTPYAPLCWQHVRCFEKSLAADAA